MFTDCVFWLNNTQIWSEGGVIGDGSLICNLQDSFLYVAKTRVDTSGNIFPICIFMVVKTKGSRLVIRRTKYFMMQSRSCCIVMKRGVTTVPSGSEFIWFLYCNESQMGQCLHQFKSVTCFLINSKWARRKSTHFSSSRWVTNQTSHLFSLKVFGGVFAVSTALLLLAITLCISVVSLCSASLSLASSLIAFT